MGRYNHTSGIELIFMAFLNSTRFPALLFTVFLLIYLIILFVNFLMILVIIFDSRLHTPMYFFIFNLTFLDVCYSSTILPQTMFNLLSHKHSITLFNCATQTFCIIAFGATQIFIVTAMAYDRYIAICNPLRYSIVMTWMVCVMLLAIIWTISIIVTLIMVFSVFTLPFCDSFEIDHFFCDLGQVLHLTCPSIQIHELVEIITFSIALSVCTIPFLLIVISYVYIISSVLKIKTKDGRRKAFSTCSSHLTVVAIEYSCLGFMYLRPKEAYSVDNDRVFVVIFTCANPLLNPLVYSVRNKSVKKGLWKLTSSTTSSF
ncbi:olfactory receptor 10Q1-like [Rhinophrynus dorsalis]